MTMHFGGGGGVKEGMGDERMVEMKVRSCLDGGEEGWLAISN